MDLDELLTEADPARTCRFDAPTSDAATRLYRQITAQPPAGRPPGRLRARVMVPAVGAVAAAGLTVALAVGVPPAAPTAPPAAAAVLDRAAATAAAQPARPALRPGRYLYLKTIQTMSKGPAGFSWSPLGALPDTNPGYHECVMTRQVWIPGAGPGRTVYTPYGSQRDAPAGTCHAFTEPFWDDGDQLGTDLPSALSANPARLARLIERRYADGRPDLTTFAAVTMLLETGEPPQVMAALYRVLKLLPGIEDLGPMSDRIGRHGIGVGLMDTGTRYELIFNPATSAILEAAAVVVTPQPQHCTPAFTMPAQTFHNPRLHKVIHIAAHHFPRSCDTPDPAGSAGYTVVISSGIVNSATATVPTPGGAPGAS
jgi:hypothetical protein